jgi:hypothetical protein
MVKSLGEQLCPVCGFLLDFAPWCGLSAADDICPSCGIQFGYDDSGGGNMNKRQEIHAKWRQLWIEAGMPWRSKGRKQPSDWDPLAQLSRIQNCGGGSLK